jgi:hypothetical protein
MPLVILCEWSHVSAPARPELELRPSWRAFLVAVHQSHAKELGTTKRWVLPLPNDNSKTATTEFASKHLSTLGHLWGVHRASIALLALVALTCCSRQKPISQNELQSQLRSAESIAAETGTFLDYVGQNRATNTYAKGHIEYLSSELAHAAKELREALPPAGAQTEFAEGREKVDELTAALRQLRSHMGQPGELAHEKDQIAAIRRQLQQAISSL